MTGSINENHKEIYRQAINHWGVPAQIQQAAEECAELIRELLHFTRPRKSNLNALIEEIADVEIMLGQVREIIQADEQIDFVKYKKLSYIKQLLNTEWQGIAVNAG